MCERVTCDVYQCVCVGGCVCMYVCRGLVDPAAKYSHYPAGLTSCDPPPRVASASASANMNGSKETWLMLPPGTTDVITDDVDDKQDEGGIL